MNRNGRLIGREREGAELSRLTATAQEGQGGIVLISGEAGVGKTRLVEEVLAGQDVLVLRGGAIQDATPPFGPVAGALRSYLRLAPAGLTGCGPLAPHLALLLPELGAAPDSSDRPTLVEAIRVAFLTFARCRPAVVFLDDLQWADHATLELLALLATGLEKEPLLVLGVYRSDEIPRSHPLRRLRSELRRLRQLREMDVHPLDPAGTTILATRLLKQAPSPHLAALLYDHTQGVPFFIEELTAALEVGGQLRRSPGGLELIADKALPIPDSVRDAVLLRVASLSESARRALEVAAVVGLDVDLALIADLVGAEEGLDEALEHGFLIEREPGQATFRHALIREALYSELPWSRRRVLHRQIAGALQAGGASPIVVAEQWLAARESELARQALVWAVDRSRGVHAYRDATGAATRALELWPPGHDEAGRLDLVERLGECAQLVGDLSDAVRAWREVADGRRLAGDLRRVAEAERRLANVYALQGAWEQGVASRKSAAAAFAAAGLPAAAAMERITAAGRLYSAANYTAARELAALALTEAEGSGRIDLKVRALSIEGGALSGLGQAAAGLARVQAALSLALSEGLIRLAGECYEWLAGVLDRASDYARAAESYQTAFEFCEREGLTRRAEVCLACLASIFQMTGDWDRAAALSRDLLVSAAPPYARAAASVVLGAIHTSRGHPRQARSLLLDAIRIAEQNGFLDIEIVCSEWLMRLDALEGAASAAAERCRLLLRRWRQTEDRFYIIGPLQWAVSLLAERGARADVRECVEVLAGVAAGGGVEALAALAHALGEAALLDGDAEQAAAHFDRALTVLADVNLPLRQIEILARLGVALVAAGQREAGIERLADAQRAARKLGARPLASRVARELMALGEPVERRLGRRVAGQLERGGLSPRELEIVRLLAVGRTNREMGEQLVLSPRTVEMHVSNILRKLDCRSRAEAVHRAGDLQLLR